MALKDVPKRLIQRHIFNIGDVSTEVPMGWGKIISVTKTPANQTQLLIHYEVDPDSRWPRRVYILREGSFVLTELEHVGSVTMDNGISYHLYLQERF